jgi:hypothetical protein
VVLLLKENAKDEQISNVQPDKYALVSENFGNFDTHQGLIGIIWIAGMEEKHEFIVESQ